jgi:hypothetical protein
MHYIDQATGERIECEVFVAILPFSGFIFCYPVHTQRTADFAYAINSMSKFYGGVTATIVCDNLRTAVKRADRYEPEFIMALPLALRAPIARGIKQWWSGP